MADLTSSISTVLKNASYLNGRPASDYALVANTAPSGYGIGGYVSSLNTISLNTATSSGRYYCVACTNTPNGANGFLDVIAQSDTVILQRYSNYSIGIFERINQSGVWSAWKQLATTDSPVFTGSFTTLKGLIAGTTDTNYLQFVDSLGTRHGYIGKGDTNPTIYLANDAGAISLMPLAGSGVGIGLIAGAVPQATLHSTGSTIIGLDGGTWGSSSLGTKQAGLYVNETNNQLVIFYKRSDGTTKTGTVQLS